MTLVNVIWVWTSVSIWNQRLASQSVHLGHLETPVCTGAPTTWTCAGWSAFSWENYILGTNDNRWYFTCWKVQSWQWLVLGEQWRCASRTSARHRSRYWIFDHAPRLYFAMDALHGWWVTPDWDRHWRAPPWWIRHLCQLSYASWPASFWLLQHRNGTCVLRVGRYPHENVHGNIGVALVILILGKWCMLPDGSKSPQSPTKQCETNELRFNAFWSTHH